MPENKESQELISSELPFWKTKSFTEMSAEEWESLCDGCGRCCLMKYIEDGSEKVFYTNVACGLLDCDSCRCKSYQDRASIMLDCFTITPENIEKSNWLPSSCAYRMLYHKQNLDWWHPLVSGDNSTVHKASMSVRHRAISETELVCKEYEDYIIDWEIGDVSPIKK